MPHPDFEILATSWTLALEADGYSPNTIRADRAALASLAD